MPHFEFEDHTEVGGTSHPHYGSDIVHGTIVSRRVLTNAVNSHTQAMKVASQTGKKVLEVGDEDGEICGGAALYNTYPVPR